MRKAIQESGIKVAMVCSGCGRADGSNPTGGSWRQSHSKLCAHQPEVLRSAGASSRPIRWFPDDDVLPGMRL